MAGLDDELAASVDHMFDAAMLGEASTWQAFDEQQSCALQVVVELDDPSLLQGDAPGYAASEQQYLSLECRLADLPRPPVNGDTFSFHTTPLNGSPWYVMHESSQQGGFARLRCYREKLLGLGDAAAHTATT